MQVTIEEISTVEKKVAIEVDWPHVAAKLDEAYKELGRGVTLKGFRKGKVPRSILERMFARQVEQEVQKKLVQETFVRAVQQHEIAPVAEPIVDDMAMTRGSGFRYSARVEVRAPFEPKDYDGVSLTRPEVTISDEEVDHAVARKREELTEYKKIEGRETLGPSDVVVADVHGEVGPHPVKRDGLMIELAATGPMEAIPGLGAHLLGAPVSAKDHAVEFTVPHTLPEGTKLPAEQRDVAGQTARLKISIREAREKLMPALDDDFAKDTGEADTLEELRGKLREKLLAEKEHDGERGLRNELVREILSRNPFEVAPALVDRQTQVMLQRTKLQMAMRGIDPRTAPLDEPKIKSSLRPAATDEVRAAFLIDAIATREKIEVSEADQERKLAELAKERGKSIPRLKADLQKDGTYESLLHQLREEKTLDLLMSRANITPKRESASPSEK